MKMAETLGRVTHTHTHKYFTDKSLWSYLLEQKSNAIQVHKGATSRNVIRMRYKKDRVGEILVKRS